MNRDNMWKILNHDASGPQQPPPNRQASLLALLKTHEAPQLACFPVRTCFVSHEMLQAPLSFNVNLQE